MRRAARVDANHKAIVETFRACHCLVFDTSAMGKGFPDLLVIRRGRILLVEVKNGAKCPSARKLTKAQVEFHAQCKAVGYTVRVVTSIADVLAMMSEDWD